MHRCLPVVGRFFFLAVLAAVSLVANVSRAAVGLTVNPSIITNNFAGKISLTVTGLTVGKTITVERFADLNGNGTNDAGEPLVLSFSVTDGQVPQIAGVRNLNVPGDEDGATNGQIPAELFFPWVDNVVFSTAVKSIFRVSDPAGGFPSATQPFTVVQKVYPQGVTGRITAAATGLPLADTPVALSNPNAPGTRVTVTDTNGHYTIYSLPGNYVVAVVKDGFISDQSLVVSVGCGQWVTNNLALAGGNLIIAGRVADGSGAGIPGIFISANSTNNLFVATFTDTNGNYVFRVPSNKWRIRPDKNQPAQLGCVALANRTDVTVTNSSVSNVNFSLPKIEAMIYGTVKDDRNNPVTGLQLSAQDYGGQYEARGRTYTTNASYTVGLISGLWPAAGPSTDELAARGYTTGTTAFVDTGGGHAFQYDFTVTRTNLPALGTPVRLSGTQLQFLLSGMAGQSYTVQAITNVNGTNWLVVLATNAACDSVTVLDTQATNSQRFYRAIVAP